MSEPIKVEIELRWKQSDLRWPNGTRAGVVWDAGCGWRAKVTEQWGLKGLGDFNTEAEARAAVEREVIKALKGGENG